MDVSPRPSDQVIRTVLACLERRRQRRRTGELPKPIPAMVIARWAGIRPMGSDDSKKRGVRNVIDEARRQGHTVLANFKGYYLPSEAADIARYRDFRKSMGLAHLVEVKAVPQRPEAIDIAGQMTFFGQ